MKQIVLINQTSGYLTEDIAEAFIKDGWKVALLASSTSLLPSKNFEFFPIANYDKANIAKRVISWWKAFRQIKSFLKKINADIPVLYFTNPPFSYFISSKLKNPFSIVVFDIWPDALDNIKCPSFIKHYWAKNNIKIFPDAQRIFTLSEGMKKSLLKYAPEEKIKVINLWPKSNNAEIIPEFENLFIKNNRLEDSFLVVYSGNMGYTHNLDVVIEVAKLLKDDSSIKFIFIGEGGKKKSLMETAEKENLNNVRFFTYLPEKDIKYSLSAANLGVVSLTAQTANASVPSKTFNLLSYGVPLLSISPENSELAFLIKHFSCGENFSPENIYQIKDWILKCKNNIEFYTSLKDDAFKASSAFTKDNSKIIVESFFN